MIGSDPNGVKTRGLGPDPQYAPRGGGVSGHTGKSSSGFIAGLADSARTGTPYRRGASADLREMRSATFGASSMANELRRNTRHYLPNYNCCLFVTRKKKKRQMPLKPIGDVY